MGSLRASLYRKTKTDDLKVRVSVARYHSGTTLHIKIPGVGELVLATAALVALRAALARLDASEDPIMMVEAELASVAPALKPTP